MQQSAATIQEYRSGDITGRGRASSSASSMSIGLSPARRSTGLDEAGLEANKETPNAKRQTGFAVQVAKMKRYRQIMGMSGPNRSESDLYTVSNGLLPIQISNPSIGLVGSPSLSRGDGELPGQDTEREGNDHASDNYKTLVAFVCSGPSSD